MNRAIRQLIHGAVLRVLDDNGITEEPERQRQLERAIEEADRLLGPMTMRIQRAINSMEAEAEGKSDEWKAGARAVIEALKKENSQAEMF